MLSFYVMHRKGVFTPSEWTDNQCKGYGHAAYQYHLKLVFDGGAKLNADKFLVDHQDIDDLIQRMELKGSCEEMHNQISKKLVPMLARKKLPLLACKCTITPTDTAVAVLEFVTLKAPEYTQCLSLT